VAFFKSTLRIDRLARLQGSLQTKSTDNVRDAGHYCRQFASALTPVRTGALKASWYVSGPGSESDYPQCSAAAQSLNPLARILPEVQAALFDPTVGQLRANTGQFALPECIVSSAVNYSIYVEEGTVFMGPQPMLRPAVESTRQLFINTMSNVAADA